MGFFSHLATSITAILISVAAFFGFAHPVPPKPVEASTAARSRPAALSNVQWVPVPQVATTSSAQSFVQETANLQGSSTSPLYAEGSQLYFDDGVVVSGYSAPTFEVGKIGNTFTNYGLGHGTIYFINQWNELNEIYPVPGTDVNTFQVLSAVYAKDKNKVYDNWNDAASSTSRIVAGADPKTFKVIALPGGYAPFSPPPLISDPHVLGMDKSFVYAGQSDSTSTDRVMYDGGYADASTFTFVFASSTSCADSWDGFAKDKNAVYEVDSWGQLGASVNVFALKDVDPNTFVDLGCGASPGWYAKDHAHVYYFAPGVGGSVMTIVPGADPSSFKKVRGNGFDAQDNYHRYLNGNAVQTVATSTPQVIYGTDGVTTTGFAKDAKGHLYFDNGGAYSMVSSSTVAGDLDLLKVDVPSFVAVDAGGGFMKDKNHVYVNTAQYFNIVKDADPNTFQVLATATDTWPEYLKDKSHVWYEHYGENIVPNADPATFAVVQGNSNYDAQDKNHKYLMGKIVQ